MNRYTLIHEARESVLLALDTWARASGLPNLPQGQPGATDADLTRLFKAIDAQVDTIIERSGVAIPEFPLSDDDITRTVRQLRFALGEKS
jgi:hypothetical protein